MARRVLDPVDRISEVLFGLIMALTFTGSLAAGEAGRADVELMLTGAIGCNIAWGLVDAVMYLMSSVVERSRNLLTLKRVREASDPEAADRIVADALPEVVADALPPAHLEALRKNVAGLQGLPPRARLGKDDWIAAAGVFGLVLVSTFPPAIPFLFIHDVVLATRVSNAVAIAMLYWCGASLARHAGMSAVRTGLVLVLLGVALVAITMALGG